MTKKYSQIVCLNICYESDNEGLSDLEKEEIRNNMIATLQQDDFWKSLEWAHTEENQDQKAS